MTPLSPADYELIEAARTRIKQLVSEKKHRLVSAIITSDGQQILGVNLEGRFGCVDICAEPIAVGTAIMQNRAQIATIVTVRHPKPDEVSQELKVANPCGKCRELLLDYAPDAWVIVRDGDQLGKVKSSELMPLRYSK